MIQTQVSDTAQTNMTAAGNGIILRAVKLDSSHTAWTDWASWASKQQLCFVLIESSLLADSQWMMSTMQCFSWTTDDAISSREQGRYSFPGLENGLTIHDFPRPADILCFLEKGAFAIFRLHSDQWWGCWNSQAHMHDARAPLLAAAVCDGLAVPTSSSLHQPTTYWGYSCTSSGGGASREGLLLLLVCVREGLECSNKFYVVFHSNSGSILLSLRDTT